MFPRALNWAIAVIIIGILLVQYLLGAAIAIPFTLCAVALALGVNRKPREEDLDVEDVAGLRRSRREIVGAFEIERRRIERDLHDGAQQYLVAATMKLGEASLSLDPDSVEGKLLAGAMDDAETAMKALRQTVHGIHPQVLTDMGLEAAVRDLARRFDNVEVRCPRPLPSLPRGVTASGYFFVSEALTNSAKYGGPAVVLLIADENLHVTVTDQGQGGATIRPGHGLSGMKERLAAFGGTLTVSSPEGGPTEVRAKMPLLLNIGESGYL
ncbi:sensor histidine kinase [Flaviflexus massiliensis]|uniref:sensor histidine kinase n=1 Tax=Flaviflexus massiliensis TaxID=1522309 RepID=UPI0009E915E9|nr:histidine kinase [Flaviflexus massiliensis]